MKVVLSHPYCWPYVRRGAERAIAELGQYFARCGWDVTTVSSKPGKGSVEYGNEGRRILYRQYWTPVLSRLRIEPAHTFLLASLHSFTSLDPDVVYSMFFIDSWAATLVSKRKHYRTIFQITGPPVPHFLPRVPPYRWMMREAVHGAHRCAVYSEYTRRIVQEYYGVDPTLTPVPIDLKRFPLGNGARHARPVILSVACFDERRKGLRVLVRAFERVRETVPDALLWLSGQMSNETRKEVLGSLPDRISSSIEVLGVGSLDDLPALYATAHLTVLASMHEAYGMVVIESWACGTPVVVTNHGGLPELLTDPSTGLCFDPLTEGYETSNFDGLAEAIVQGLKLSDRQDVRPRCRRRAETYDWSVLGPRYEELFRAV
jgi:glycosyltransferase involved in cell wall biosynthesis